MNWSYISVFFDPDISLMLSYLGNSKYKTPSISFKNCEYEILNEIQKFILKETLVKDCMSKKKPQSINHYISYDLKFDYFNKVNLILDKMDIVQPKKLRGKEEIKKMIAIIPRNGKYNENSIRLRRELENEFFRE